MARLIKIGELIMDSTESGKKIVKDLESMGYVIVLQESCPEDACYICKKKEDM